MQLRHHVGCFRHRVNDVIGKHRGVRRRESHALEPLDFAARTQELGERTPVAELHSVGVHVLTKESHFKSSLVHEFLNLGENLAGATVLLLPSEGRNDAERARVVAAD